MVNIKAPKKLIEVALPLDAINVAAAREKSIRHGHPSTLHLWWARRPLAAARAVLFAQMVNDPGYQQGGGFRYGVNKGKAALERERLFKIIEELVQWENTNNEEVLERARAEIRRSWRETCELNKNHPQAAELFNPEKLPGFHDPFAGGGAIPLEAQRLGLESYASDLNPVAVTINKAMIEIPPRFASKSPVGPRTEGERQTRLHDDWTGAKGLAEDVRRYGAWMRAEAEKRIGHLYPKVEITADIVQERPDLKILAGQKLTAIAWLWARTVNSPSPAFGHVKVPLALSFVLSSKEGAEAFVLPQIGESGYQFKVLHGKPRSDASTGTRATGRGGNFICIMSGAPISGDFIKAEAQAGRMGARLMAVVAQGVRGRVYLSPTAQQEEAAKLASPGWKPEVEFCQHALGFRVGNYGMRKWSDLFTDRQLVALGTISDLVQEVVANCRQEAIKSGAVDDGVALDDGGHAVTAYAQAVGVYLAAFLSRMADLHNNLCQWRSEPAKQHVGHLFSRQAVPMVWDFAEANPLGSSAGGFNKTLEFLPKVFPFLPLGFAGLASQADAQTQAISRGKVVSTDPPYYDNIGYADLSDFFYVWLRKNLKSIHPKLFATVAVPKGEELVATPSRHGGKVPAETFFLRGMTQAMHNLAEQTHPAFPITIYYAFKQSETKGEAGTSSTGWETFLEAVFSAGLALTGTWPMRTELKNRTRGGDSNALASSIVLVCRQRAVNAQTVSRRQFIRELNAVLPEGLDEMTRGGVNSPVAPVDLSQAIIGPGMAIFSQYAAVLEADGTPMRVKTALQLINRFLAEDDFDHDTQFCLHWFENFGWTTGNFGDANTLAQAKGTSVDRLRATGVVESGKGNLRLMRWAELPRELAPERDNRLPVWEALHHLIRGLNQHGESGAGALLARIPTKAEAVRALAYRLYTLSERRGWAEEARAYNGLVNAWTAIEQAASEAGVIGSQTQLDI